MSYICNCICRIFAKVNIMAIKDTLEGRISYRINRSSDTVFMREDFSDIGGYDQVGRILKNLVRKEALISLGYGVYARANKSTLTGNIIPEKPLPDLAREALKKIGIKTTASKAEQDYNKGITTQVPTGRVIGVKGRVSRKLGFNGKYVYFERAA